MKVAAALQKQAIRDLAPIWSISATVDAFERLEDVPTGYWPLIIKDDIEEAGAEGIHMDKDGQPFALITARSDLNAWSLTASHESLEMLVDPFGNRLVAGDSPAQGQGRVEFLVEVCDPSEAADFAYRVNNILVSDFYTPHYFDPVKAAGVRYSFTGAIKGPRQVLKGGYLSWHDPVSDHWFQLTFFSGSKARVRDIGKLDAKASSFRVQVDRMTEQERMRVAGPKAAQAKLQASAAEREGEDSSVVEAERLRSQIAEILGSSKPPTDTSGRKPRAGRASTPPADDDDQSGSTPEKYPIER
jgi:hypothetical protein